MSKVPKTLVTAWLPTLKMIRLWMKACRHSMGCILKAALYSLVDELKGKKTWSSSVKLVDQTAVNGCISSGSTVTNRGFWSIGHQCAWPMRKVNDLTIELNSFWWPKTTSNYPTGTRGIFPKWPYFEIGELLLMLQKSGEKTTFWMYKNLVNIGINYQPQLVSLPDFWSINSRAQSLPEVLENANDSVVTVESRYFE